MVGFKWLKAFEKGRVGYYGCVILGLVSFCIPFIGLLVYCRYRDSSNVEERDISEMALTGFVLNLLVIGAWVVSCLG